MPSASTRSGSDRTMNDSVITSRASLLAARCAPAANTPTTAAAGRRTIGHQRAADGKSASSARRPRSSFVAYAASSASRISGWRRVCSWKPISRFASTASSTRAFGSRLELPRSYRVERLAQVALPVGRVARPQSVEEPPERIRGRPAGTPAGSARTRARSPRTPSGSRAPPRRWHARTRRTACAALPSGARSACRAGRGRGAAADARAS